MRNYSVLLQNTKTTQKDAHVIYSLSCQNVSIQDSWHYNGLPDVLISTNNEREQYGCSGDKLCYVKAFLP